MGLLRRKKEGFTIVELVIVIGVIGILSAILIPTFVVVSEQAKVASSKSFIKNINTVVAVNEAQTPSSKAKTMHVALEQGKIAGFDIDKIDAPKDAYVIWDSLTRRFALVSTSFDPLSPDMSHVLASEGDLLGRGVDLWRVYDEVPDVSEQTYSICAGRNFATQTIHQLKVGFDEGNAVVNSVRYVHDGPAQTVSIRAMGSDVYINAPNDTVHLYEWVNELDVEAVGSLECLHVYGYVQDIHRFDSGKLIVEEGARMHQTEAQIRTVLGSNETIVRPGSHFEVPYYDTPPYEADNHFIDVYGEEPSPEYPEEPAVEEEYDVSDLSELYHAFDGIEGNYTSHTQSFFNRAGAYDYFRHYRRNCVQEKIQRFTSDCYYVHPVETSFLPICNQGYLNYNGNVTSFSLPESTVEERLSHSLRRGELSLYHEDRTYQQTMFTLGNLNEAYLSGRSFSRIGLHRYESRDATMIADGLTLVAPGLTNKGLYVLPERIVIETSVSEETPIRIRLYVSSLNAGALIACHTDPEKPLWQYLFAEAEISHIGTTELTLADSLGE
ncbi:MAG: prepilin-type N-terminal cleavage/methylation domain-containing protein [Bacilli bacterium]|nr:prepilin-type N-terminal cleavage/methylation domain-containing protein [Bacilli bacterium]